VWDDITISPAEHVSCSRGGGSTASKHIEDLKIAELKLLISGLKADITSSCKDLQAREGLTVPADYAKRNLLLPKRPQLTDLPSLKLDAHELTRRLGIFHEMCHGNGALMVQKSSHLHKAVQHVSNGLGMVVSVDGSTSWLVE
jgi:hypothetical protein